ncbi:MAG: Txe/YoeB family addiction module toxin [Prevotellaceae bacterium]|jgi:toxin YoeB|nr:Txe/YoeB family addiction module toxin [Prevotellaceae bacterium]
MIYKIEFTNTANKDIAMLKKNDVVAYKKLLNLLAELEQHPETGTGKPELLKYQFSGYYSRRITIKHRLVYRIEEEIVTVIIVSAYGHYSDK